MCLQIESEDMTSQALSTFSEITTLHVGGEIERLERVATYDDLLLLLDDLRMHNQPFMMLGGGSNVVAADERYEGTVVIFQCDDDPVVRTFDDGRVQLIVHAGLSWDGLVQFCVDQGYAGPEALSGIPGSAGAAPIQNIGAYGYEVARFIDRIEVFDRQTGEVSWRAYHRFHPRYRMTDLKAYPERFVVTRISLLLDRQDRSLPVAYGQLADALGVSVGQSCLASEVRSAVLNLRISKGMVYSVEDYDTWSCGSFFTNPIVNANQLQRIPEDIARYLQDDGVSYKLSAAALIERAGCHKGYTCSPEHSQASLSHKHVLALTNRGHALASDVVALAYDVRQRVYDAFGVMLTSEPVGIGLELP